MINQVGLTLQDGLNNLKRSNMERVLTAEEFYHQAINDNTIGSSITDLMNAYAKLHVEAALKAASENAKVIDVGIDYAIEEWVVEKSSILKSYPLENIK